MTAIFSDPRLRECLFPISVEKYHQMGRAGILDERTELIDGVIFQKMIKSPLHTYWVRQLMAVIQPQLPETYEVRKEEPLTLLGSEPEPDLAIVRAGSYDPLIEHPSSAELVIEVAMSSEAIDRAKASIYSAARVQQFWLVLPEKSQIEIFSAPTPTGYTSMNPRDLNETLRFQSDFELIIDLNAISQHGK